MNVAKLPREHREFLAKLEALESEGQILGFNILRVASLYHGGADNVNGENCHYSTHVSIQENDVVSEERAMLDGLTAITTEVHNALHTHQLVYQKPRRADGAHPDGN